ncbi:MAG: PspC domain-containing protein [Alphaproteobacteria bacterium]|nr:PspC domain-containing protein [Alphaproteobacteria bacterium]
MTNSDIKRLYRSKKDRVLGGVCAGIANYFNVDPVLIRVAWVVGFFIGGVGFLAYLIAWIIMPEEPGI